MIGEREHAAHRVGEHGEAPDARIEELFRAQVARTPEAPAVRFAGERVSYGDLDRWSEAIAEQLVRQGAGPEQRVAVCLERTPSLVAALLGVLKAGAAYVPLDPEYPEERLAFMLDDSGAGLALAEAATRERLAGFSGTVIEVGKDGAEADEPVSGSPRAATRLPDHLAYVIYTSGSTGRPKGVAIPHAPVCRLLSWAAGVFTAEELRGVLAATSVCFDLSVFELFLPLTRGGAVVLAADALELARLPDAGEVTLINTVPSAIGELLRADAVPPSARTVNLAGEPLSRSLVERIYATGTVDRVLNLYGPSEDTTYSTWSEVERGESLPVTIGVPIDGTRAVVADGRGRPVTDGDDGELLLGGGGLARGYLGRPGLTAERWVPDAGSGGEAEPGARLYRTGDLVRRRPDGRLHFIGRIDHQVKVRGFRIELGEIESALLGHPALDEAVATVLGERPEDRRLVAYWTPLEGSPPSEAELKQLLAERLPAYMVPGRLIRLDELPRTPNGKVDRNRLPAPEGLRPEDGPAYREPQTGAERELASWGAELLGLDRAGADDSLFELGGHSLIATQVAARVRESFGVDLPPVEVFSHPTPARLAERIEQLTHGGEAGAEPVSAPSSPTPPPLVPAGRDRKLPLSFPQEQIWLIMQLAPQMRAYNFQFTVRLRGRFDRGALLRTLAEIIDRHEIYRTSFPSEDGEPVQRIHPPYVPDFPECDLSALSPLRREEEAERVVEARVRRSFDVTRLPLLEWTLVRMAADDYMMIQAEHHFVHDGWSISVFVHEMTVIYGDFVAGRPSSLAPPVQFADFAVWQREWLTGETLQRELEAWSDRLGEPPPPLELTTDRPRPRHQSFRGDRFDAFLPPDLYAAVRSFGRREGFTLFMTMLAAFQALLYRYSGRETFLLGSGVANRRLRDLEGVLGMVVNTLVLRADVGGRPTFRELLSRARDEALFMQTHQDLPFEALVAELAPERDLSRNPLFAHLFSFHDAPVPDIRMGELSGELLERRNGSAKADWNVIVRPRAEQRVGREASAEDQLLRVLWEFSTDLYDRTTIARAWGHYQTLLRGAVENPERTPDELPMLTAEELEQLTAWQAPGSVPSTGSGWRRPLVERALEHGASRPRAPAVVSASGRALTYGELSDGSASLARRLGERGVEPGGLVAVCLPPSPELAVAAVAARRCGAAYLPLDPDHPRQRTEYSLSDARADALVTTPEIAASLSEEARQQVGAVLEVDPSAEAAAGDGEQARGAEPAGAAARAYVIYTSGTTGRPKGTELTEGGLSNLVDWHCRTYRLTGDDRCPWVASPAFDASVWELWPVLAAGASLHVPPPEVKAEPERLAGWMGEQDISLAFLPTPLAEGLLGAIEDGAPAPRGLRSLLTGGDRLHRVPAGLPFAVVNHYGPTEATVVATAGVAPAGSQDPPIGVPIGGHEARVLDRDSQRLPAGVAGELWVSGAGLARGYLGRPGLTADRFRPDPYASQPGGRMYRTGDRVRWLPSGELDFLGRSDDQVQVRGVRVEPAEVAAVLEEHPAVRRAVVVALPAGDRLAAFWTPAAGSSPAAADLARHAARHLPEAAVPSSFEALDELPVGATGKLDRARLVRQAQATAAGEPGGGAGAEPRNALEAAVAEAWRDILGVAQVGAHDGFFRELGGHSLLAARAVARLRKLFGVELVLADLFDHPTPAEMARHVGELMGRDEPGGEEIPVADRESALPLSFGQQRLWLVDRLIADRSTYTIARVWDLNGGLEVGALRRAVADVTDRHESLRTRFVEAAGEEAEPRQAIDPPGGRLALAAVDLSALPEPRRSETCGRLTDAWARTPFDLARGPLTRWLVIGTGGRSYRLALAQHHAVSDGWSLGVLLGDLAAAYEARRQAGVPRLPALSVQPADVAVWQRRRLGGDRLERLLGWWREALDGMPQRLDLPTDRPRGAVQRHRGARYASRLDATAVSGLRELGRESGATLFMSLLALWGVVLGRWSGQRRLLVGAPVAARDRAETERLVGFFVNTLALPIRLDDEPSFAELLGRVREIALGAYAHAELPFERLVEEVTDHRDLSGSPLFQVTLALQGGEPGALSLDGVQVEPVPVARREAHFDITLFVQESDAGLELAWSYDRDLFDASTVERMAEHLTNLAASVASNPAGSVFELPMIGAAEHDLLVHEWNATQSEYPRSASLWERFCAVAERQPEALAVVWDGGRWTYGELAQRAERLAAAIGPQVAPVGVAIGRSPHMVAALLAALAAGGGYLPLDAAYPPERLAFMIGDAGVELVLTDEASTAVPTPAGVRVLTVDALMDESESDNRPAGLPPSVGGDALAYLMYTSGSTGVPKAVAVSHRNVARLVLGGDCARFGRDRVFLQLAPVSFDAATLEIWGPLLTGGSLALMPAGAVDTGEIAQAVERFGVTTMWLTAGLFHQLVEDDPAALASLDELLAGGDVLSPERLREAREGMPSTTLINGYGPTENTTFTTCHRMEPEDPIGSPVPIGRPIANTRAYVLDDLYRPVPIGVAGELFAGGDGVARGYHRRPSQTAAAFVPDPWGEGARLYRTGDLARRREDGTLEFLGRRDRQVKLRGFRLEPAEIEACLAAAPGVGDVAVVLREDRPGDPRLAAYWVPEAGADGVAADELRAWVAERLPEVMVPADLVSLDRLPLTPNGKLDRGALPAPDRSRADAELVAPRTASEKQVAELWSRALGVDRVGAEDDFFALGGNSLLATRVMARLRREVGVELHLRTFFLHPTVAGLAAEIDRAVAERTAADPAGEGAGSATTIRRVSRAARRRPVDGLTDR